MKQRSWRETLLTGVMCLLLFCFPSKSLCADDLFAGAAEEVAAKCADSLSDFWKSPRAEGIRKGETGKLALWDVEKDRNEIILSRLKSAILESGHFDLYPPADTNDFKKILKEHGKQIKYQDHYDPASLVALRKLIASRLVIVAKVESIDESSARTDLRLVAKLLDLETGKEAWVKIIKDGAKRVFSTMEWLWRSLVCLAVVSLCVFFVFWANWQSLRFFHFWIVLAALAGAGIWVLIGRYL